MNTKALAPALLVLAVLVAAPLHASAWEQLGPDGGILISFAQDPVEPSRLYAGTLAAGVFVSSDRGNSWRRSGLGVNHPVGDLVVGQGAVRGVYAASVSEVYESFDHGTTWSSTGLDAPGLVNAIGADRDFVYAVTSQGLFRRAAGGEWALVNADRGLRRAYQIFFDGRDTLYVASGGLYASTDSGVTFTRLAPGLFDGHVFQVALEPRTNELLVRNSTPRGIFRSSGGRTSWSSITENLPRASSLSGFTVQPTRSGAIVWALAFGNLYRSTDLGASWELLERRFANRFGFVELVADLSAPQTLYAPGNLGLARTLDGGESWSFANRGLTAFELDDYALGGGDPATIYASNTQGIVYGSDDGGDDWTLLAQPEFALAAGLAVDPRDPRTVYRGLSESVARSTDGGTTWTSTETELDCNEIYLIEVADADPSVLYAAGISVTSECSFSVPDACFSHRSVDAGRTWSCTAPLGFPQRFVIDPRDAFRVYALERGRVSRSDDGGASWSELSAGLEPPFLDLDLDPADPDALYLVDAAGVLRSDDRGASWRRVGGAPPVAIEALVPHPLEPDNLFAVGAGHTLASADGGESWRELPGEDPALGLQEPLVILPAEPTHLYAGTRGAGVVRRTVPVESECLADADTLCLAGGRFEVEVEWRDFRGRTGVGGAQPLTGDTGAFHFFRSGNLELMVKALDGRPVNGSWWIFFGALTNVEFTLTVKDTATGQVRTYLNPSRTFASRGDTQAFPPLDFEPAGAGDRPVAPTVVGWRAVEASAGERSVASPSGSTRGGASEGGCVPDAQSLCLSDRFRLRVTWRDFAGRVGAGGAVPLAGDTGAFYFFRPGNLELMVKVLDGGPVNGHWWVFFGALTNVEFTLTVEDLVTGDERTYVNPARTFASRGDTTAFPQ